MPDNKWIDEIADRVAFAAAVFDGYTPKETELVKTLISSGAEQHPDVVKALIGSSVIEENYFVTEEG